jgi:hypothetical protein
VRRYPIARSFIRNCQQISADADVEVADATVRVAFEIIEDGMRHRVARRRRAVQGGRCR